MTNNKTDDTPEWTHVETNDEVAAREAGGLVMPPEAALVDAHGRPMHNQPGTVTKRPTRQQLRQHARKREKLKKGTGQLVAECRHGDLRILPCLNPAHPFHVHIFSSEHGEWLPCDDDSDMPMVMLAVMAGKKVRVESGDATESPADAEADDIDTDGDAADGERRGNSERTNADVHRSR